MKGSKNTCSRTLHVLHQLTVKLIYHKYIHASYFCPVLGANNQGQEASFIRKKAGQRIAQLIIGDGQEVSDGDGYMPYRPTGLTSSQVLISRFHRPATTMLRNLKFLSKRVALYSCFKDRRFSKSFFFASDGSCFPACMPDASRSTSKLNRCAAPNN